MLSPISDEEFSKKFNESYHLNNNKIHLKSSFILGVSGGPDSMALSHLFKNWSKENNKKILAVIVDHKIRNS